ncbi:MULTISPECIES: hypothetical protein [unclassified Sphingobacterium]|uniref:hypothetical protein n=1 Tax=unclassified Sphingobacterium TaxID=2609468 RepID=UPI0025E069EA|nr:MULTISPECIES: hypothetical protein [unclassified Sphingobacterium]
MLENLPIHIPLIFGLTTVMTLFLFSWIIKAAKSPTTRQNSTKIIVGLIVWLIIQAILTLKNTYNSDTNSFPPKILLFGILPPIFTIIVLFSMKKGRQFIDTLSLTKITYLHFKPRKYIASYPLYWQIPYLIWMRYAFRKTDGSNLSYEK